MCFKLCGKTCDSSLDGCVKLCKLRKNFRSGVVRIVANHSLKSLNLYKDLCLNVSGKTYDSIDLSLKCFKCREYVTDNTGDVALNYVLYNVKLSNDLSLNVSSKTCDSSLDGCVKLCKLCKNLGNRVVRTVTDHSLKSLDLQKDLCLNVSGKTYDSIDLSLKSLDCRENALNGASDIALDHSRYNLKLVKNMSLNVCSETCNCRSYSSLKSYELSVYIGCSVLCIIEDLSLESCDLCKESRLGFLCEVSKCSDLFFKGLKSLEYVINNVGNIAFNHRLNSLDLADDLCLESRRKTCNSSLYGFIKSSELSKNIGNGILCIIANHILELCNLCKESRLGLCSETYDRVDLSLKSLDCRKNTLDGASYIVLNSVLNNLKLVENLRLNAGSKVCNSSLDSRINLCELCKNLGCSVICIINEHSLELCDLCDESRLGLCSETYDCVDLSLKSLDCRDNSCDIFDSAIYASLNSRTNNADLVKNLCLNVSRKTLNSRSDSSLESNKLCDQVSRRLCVVIKLCLELCNLCNKLCLGLCSETYKCLDLCFKSLDSTKCVCNCSVNVLFNRCLNNAKLVEDTSLKLCGKISNSCLYISLDLCKKSEYLCYGLCSVLSVVANHLLESLDLSKDLCTSLLCEVYKSSDLLLKSLDSLDSVGNNIVYIVLNHSVQNAKLINNLCLGSLGNILDFIKCRADSCLKSLKCKKNLCNGLYGAICISDELILKSLDISKDLSLNVSRNSLKLLDLSLESLKSLECLYVSAADVALDHRSKSVKLICDLCLNVLCKVLDRSFDRSLKLCELLDNFNSILFCALDHSAKLFELLENLCTGLLCKVFKILYVRLDEVYRSINIFLCLVYNKIEEILDIRELIVKRALKILTKSRKRSLKVLENLSQIILVVLAVGNVAKDLTKLSDCSVKGIVNL